MRGIYRFYDKQIAGGKGFFGFTIFFALLIRCLYLFNTELLPSANITSQEGYLWELIAPVFSNIYVSITMGAILLGILALMVHIINVRYAFIRKKTLLPSSIIILLFSSTPHFIVVSPLYIYALTILWVMFNFFEAYTSLHKQAIALKISFNFALGSLFAPFLSFFLPIIWLCLARIRCLNFKSFLASIFGIFIVYIPTLTIFFFVGGLNQFLAPFNSLTTIDWTDIPLLHYTPLYYGLITIMILLFSTILVNNHLYRHKDKVKVRGYLSILTIIITFSIFTILFVNLSPLFFTSIILAAGALHLGHFFSLTEHRAIILLFFVLFLAVITFSIFPFF